MTHPQNMKYIAPHCMNTPSRLLILVGTVTNTAERVARAIQMDCADLIGQIDVRLMDGLDIRVFDEDALYVICSATHGAGDVPDNASALYDSLDREPRFLGHVRYGVIALGDSIYPQTFCNGGLRFDERLPTWARCASVTCFATMRPPAPRPRSWAPHGAVNG
jgi:MioC protein